MKLLRNLAVPTGNICVVRGTKGPLEFISVGDYGKQANLKADFLGLHDEIQSVPHQEMMPLTEKWVITVSTQYGCGMGCRFCDVPKVGAGLNATLGDMQGQVITGLHLHPEVTTTKRLNVHFARMGEPTWNPNVLECAKWLHEHVNPEYKVHPVVSTMMPKDNEWLRTFVHTWMRIKNRLYGGGAGLQLSINSTDKDERDHMFRGSALSLFKIHEVMQGIVPHGRKITLNFAVAGYTIDAERLAELFSPEHYLCKLTPMHQTYTAEQNDIRTDDGYCSYYPYRQHEEDLKAVGYDVIVFLPSIEEDLGRITCGNAILSGSLPEVEYKEV